MSEHSEHYRFRKDLVSGLVRDLLGPVDDEQEVLSDPPLTTYTTGILHPRRAKNSGAEAALNLSADAIAESDVDLTSAPSPTEEVPDTGVAMANVQAPSSMGLTFAIDPSVSNTIDIAVTAAVYEPIDQEGNRTELKRRESRSTEDDGVRWKRRAFGEILRMLDIENPPAKPVEVVAGLELRFRVRPPSDDGSVAVTVTLVNVNTAPTNTLQDEYCFFQPRLRITGPEDVCALVQRPGPGGGDEGEIRLNRLLHRYAPTFAVGHGCAAEWDWTPLKPAELVRQAGAPAAVAEVRSTFVPSHEVLLTDSNRDIDNKSLGMQRLATATDDDVFTALEGLVRGYGAWIDEREQEVDFFDGTPHHDVAIEQIKRCRRARERMAAGIVVLRKDGDALLAFRLANEAMARQRGRANWIRGGRVGEPPLEGTWRPFQIAFVLHCLNGIVDDEHPDRYIADLLWFPTGGGKTEAYLGLIAFTVFLRRIRRKGRGGGVTAIMRYTLRLLTLQQFERAAALICAMEWIRRRDRTVLGDEEVSLGMWVGAAATPNKLRNADASLKELRKGKELQKENPVQLRACPWCGMAMDLNNYEVDLDALSMRIFCGNQECDFHDALPVHVVDEMIYRVHPTLIIATSDKFARIAWRDDVAALFNRDLDGVPQPELIVQDELHLISGPLGSLAGLYETAIDEAADHPKVIASTATIRRADKQGLALFCRDVAQFPPGGLDARDSWFSVEAGRDKKASRRYVGLVAPNTSQATLLVRAYASLLHNAHLVQGDTSVRDAYWTLVGYFNSLRLLAAAELQVKDDVQDRLQLLAEHDGSKGRSVDVVAELTSRVSSSDIPVKLKDLERKLPDENTPDVVLATNMISVGVDIDRLGLMAIMGQPQTTAEYIQSSSRVGRKHPGLVVMLFNAARSRDRSHYENFLSYHSALYRQVESTSVTPFSSRARERGLHAVLVGMARLLFPEARPNAAAAAVENYLPRLEEVKSLVLARVSKVAPEEYEGTAADIDDVIADWQMLASSNAELVYEAEPNFKRSRERSPDEALLRSFTDEDLTEAYDTLWSLRDVDDESDLYLER